MSVEQLRNWMDRNTLSDQQAAHILKATRINDYLKSRRNIPATISAHLTTFETLPPEVEAEHIKAIKNQLSTTKYSASDITVPLDFGVLVEQGSSYIEYLFNVKKLSPITVQNYVRYLAMALKEMGEKLTLSGIRDAAYFENIQQQIKDKEEGNALSGFNHYRAFAEDI